MDTEIMSKFILRSTVLIVFFGCANLILKAQNDSSNVGHKDTTWVVVIDSFTFGRNAQTDIDSNTVKIYVPCGYGCSVEFNTKADLFFEEKYELNFLTQGCLKLIDEEMYNKTIFKHLDSKYGDAWRNDLRKELKDYIGI